jgi:hypothetical protein
MVRGWGGSNEEVESETVKRKGEYDIKRKEWRHERERNMAGMEGKSEERGEEKRKRANVFLLGKVATENDRGVGRE